MKRNKKQKSHNSADFTHTEKRKKLENLNAFFSNSVDFCQKMTRTKLTQNFIRIRMVQFILLNLAPNFYPKKQSFFFFSFKQ